MKPTLFTSKSDCCSCKACMNACPKNAIISQEDENGFVYPYIDESKCVGCNICVNTCQFGKNTDALQEPAAAYAAINKNAEVLKKSSSGGCFSALAEIILEQGGVVFGAAMDSAFHVKHISVENIGDLGSLRGSKYVLSDIGYSYRNIKNYLDEGRKVLFTGTPCQVSGLYGYLKNKDYPGLITVDVVCHGTPSQAMFNKYIEYLEKKKGVKVTGYCFRTKNRTWKRFEPAFDTDKTSNNRIGKFDEFYHPSFISGNITQESCHTCPYASRKRIADFTMCDYWGFEKAELNLDERKGLSALMFNNDRALALYDALSEKLYLEKTDYEAVVQGNGCLRKPLSKGKQWDYYMKAFRNNTIGEAADRYKKKNKKQIIKQNILYMLPYSLYKRLKQQ